MIVQGKKFNMLKWFGLESNASQGEDPATATKKDDEKCNQSTDNRENTPTKAKTGTESPSNTSSVAGAYGGCKKLDDRCFDDIISTGK